MNDQPAELQTIILGSRDWMLGTGILVAAILVFCIWSYSIRGRFAVLRTLAAGLKIAGVCALAFCLLEPMRRTERPKPGANLLAMVVDDSRSMQMQPPGASRSRAERYTEVLGAESAWQERLAQDFEVRRYAYSDRLRAVESLNTLPFDGNHSALAGSIDTLGTRFANRPVAGMLLFSDGIATDAAELERLVEDYPFPIYPVIYDSESSERDIAITDATVAVSAYELAPAGIEATVRARGFSGRNLTVRLLADSGETIEKRTVRCESDDFEQRVRMQFKPPEPGFQFVYLRAMLENEDQDGLEVDSSKEVTVENNLRLLAVDRGGGPYRVLYVSGRPNWEFKFIRRALEEDVEIELKGLIRIAKKEPKFRFGDRGVDTSNPLLSGFSDDEETTEQYDEPVLLRLGVEEDELKAGFPSGREDLFHYHAIMLDDVEASFFTSEQMMLMRQFVADRGGGLMMLGGQESFLGGGYQDSPLGDVLPVYLRGRESTTGKDQPVRYRLTREGGLEPWLRLRSEKANEQKRVDQMPDFFTWNSVADVKPGASVLASMRRGEEDLPGLVAQRFGRGRSLALLVGDFWRWSMRRATEDTDDLAQSWRQMTRWLTNDVPKRLSADVESPVGAIDAHKIIVKVLDSEYSPLDNARLELTITEPDGQIVHAIARPDAARPGTYVAEYWSRIDGGYRCMIEATGPDGEVFEPRDTGWVASPSAKEFAQIEPNRALLEQLAERSGGELVPIDQLESFAKSLPTKKVPITEARIEPLWHRPWFVLFAVACLCVEWGLRRWKGLP